MLETQVAAQFAEDGALARVPGFRPRPAQVELARAIARTLSSGKTLVAEAGTGTGKTWAYLVPALLAGGKVLVSTGTRTLQDQLFKRDLPRVRAALAVPVTVALLKGRGNYVCHYHLGQLEQDDRGLRSRAEIGQLRRIRVFANESQTGDRADLSTVPEMADIWQRVTSTHDNCLGQECPNVRDCFVIKARRQAQEADIVVVNHALFMADLALREEGVTDLLPEASAVIFDEAHQLPDVATRFLGDSLSSHQLLDLSRQVQAVGLAQARESCHWAELCGELETAVREWRLACAALEQAPGRKATLESLGRWGIDDFDARLIAVGEALAQMAVALKACAERHPDLAAALRSVQGMQDRLARWGGKTGATAVTARAEPAQASLDAPQALPGDEPAQPDAAVALPTNMPLVAAVRWVELGAHHLRIQRAPLSVSETFSRCRLPGQAWVMTSATLSVWGDFSHFIDQLGLVGAEIGRWESPFDYAEQGLLFVPKSLPQPQSPQFTQAFAGLLADVLAESEGGALVLCTTLRAVERIAQALEDIYDERGWDWPLMRQGQGARGELLERFRKEPHAVLVGSATFWEGVDVPGDALRLVAIDKLPFAPPDDPVVEARVRACRERGGNPFDEYQLPEAAIALKQGAGRLIRTESDWGVLMVGDARLVDKPYGKRLWRGLPPFARTRDVAEAQAFFRQRRAKENKAEQAPEAVVVLDKDSCSVK